MAKSSARSVLENAVSKLASAGVDSPLLDAQLLLASVLNCSRTDLIAHPERLLTDPQFDSFFRMLDRRGAREPLPYLTGRREFYGLEIEVTPAVLIPRPETEFLVEECARRVRRPAPVIADIGAGSGAIAVALAVSVPDAIIYATDILPGSLQVAKANAEKHDVSERVRALEGDLVEPLLGLDLAFDAIVSNPPYIPTGEIDSLQPEVRCEPVKALDGGPDGLDAYRKLFPAAKSLLRKSGFIAVEVGAGQAASVRRIANDAGYRNIETIWDLAAIERVVVAYR